MAEIVKNLGEAQAKGLISSQNAQKSEIGSILSDVKGIIEGIKDLRGLQKPKQEENVEVPINEPTPQISNKTPTAILKIKDEEIEKLLSDDLKKIVDNPNVNPDMPLKELVENWGHLKELLKPEIKKFIQRTAKAEIEFK